MCACHKVIQIESAGARKHHIGLDNVSTESFNRNDKKVYM